MPNSLATRGQILITGSSTGIGKACVLYLLQRGYSVIASVRKEADAESLQRHANGSSGKLQTMLLDITDASSIATSAQTVRSLSEGSGLWALVNNAGVGVIGPVEHVSIADWRRQFEVNLFGQIALTQAMLPLLRENVSRQGKGAGRLVFVGSIAGRVGQPMLGPYCASKHALEALCDVLRTELAEQGIFTSLLEPGAIQSEIWRKGNESVETFSALEQARPLYGKLMDAVQKFAAASAASALPADYVSRAVERCIISRKPPTRVLIGSTARLAGLMRRLLPDRAFDRLLMRNIKI